MERIKVNEHHILFENLHLFIYHQINKPDIKKPRNLYVIKTATRKKVYYIYTVVLFL